MADLDYFGGEGNQREDKKSLFTYTFLQNLPSNIDY